MSRKHIISVLLGVLTMCSSLWAQAQHVSLCSLQQNPVEFLNSKVEVEALLFAGVEYPRLKEGQCSFRYANGDDYQTFGKRFPVNNDQEWKLLKKVLSSSECASNVRVAKAKIVGTVIRTPATGTIPQDEMPFELVIQSVSGVSRVPMKCSPRSTLPPDTLLHEGLHVSE